MTCDSDDLCEIVITAPDPEWLLDFTRNLVADGLAAAVHQTEILTTYTWEGEQVTTGEARAALRTRQGCFDEIAYRTQNSHPYAVPSIVVIPIIQATNAYSNWLRANTRAH